MKETNKLLTSLVGNSDGLDRRKFLGNAGKGILAATLLGEFAGEINAQQKPVVNQRPVPNMLDTIPVKLPPRDAETEKKEAPLPAPLNPEQRIGYAIVGLGALSLAEILPAFGECKYSKPVALVSGSLEKATKVANQYGIPVKNIYNYQTYDQMKNNPDIDVVFIVLPNGMHAEYTIRAAKAGKHVLCEKPMANTSKEAQQMIDACKQADRKLMIAYRIQYEPNHHKIKQWVREKKYGTVKMIESVNTQNIGDAGQWRLNKALAGGGSLPDIGLYCLNTSRYLLGEEPESVLASVYSTPGDPRFKEVEETVMFQLKFPSGALVNCTTSYGVHESRRYRCHGDKGTWFGMDPAFPYHGLQMEISQAIEEAEWRQHPSFGQKNQFALEIDHMSLSVMNNTKPYTPGEEGLQDHRIMEAIYQSAKEGRPINLTKYPGTDVFRGKEPKSA